MGRAARARRTPALRAPAARRPCHGIAWRRRLSAAAPWASRAAWWRRIRRRRRGGVRGVAAASAGGAIGRFRSWHARAPRGAPTTAARHLRRSCAAPRQPIAGGGLGSVAKRSGREGRGVGAARPRTTAAVRLFRRRCVARGWPCRHGDAAPLAMPHDSRTRCVLVWSGAKEGIMRYLLRPEPLRSRVRVLAFIGMCACLLACLLDN